MVIATGLAFCVRSWAAVLVSSGGASFKNARILRHASHKQMLTIIIIKIRIGLFFTGHLLIDIYLYISSASEELEYTILVNTLIFMQMYRAVDIKSIK
jgi:hypothetical protein